MYKTAIIGLGQIGYKLDNDSFRDLIWSHSKAYTKHNNTKLIAVCDIDKEVMKISGITFCPSDAHESIKAISDYVLKTKGGQGVIRELLDLITKKKGK